MTNPQIIFSLIQNSYSYIMIFALMLVEGPITTFIAAFIASQGFLNIYYIFLLSILGNAIPDIIFYLIGKHSGKKFLDKVVQKFNIKSQTLKNIKEGMEKHIGKTIISIKLIPGLAIPGLIFIGFNNIDYKKFFKYGILFDIISEGIFLLLGYFSGISSTSLLKIIKLEQYSILILIILVILIYFLYKKIKNRLKIEP